MVLSGIFFPGFVIVQGLKNWLMMSVNVFWHITFSNFSCVIIFVEVHVLTAVSMFLAVFIFSLAKPIYKETSFFLLSHDIL